MFRQLAAAMGVGGQDAVLRAHPADLAHFLEWAWLNRNQNIPERLTPFPSNPAVVGPPAVFAPAAGLLQPAPPPPGQIEWQHLIYAYMIENTRAYEVIARIVRECGIGEKFGVLPRGALLWLRATEELLFKDPPLFSISSVASHTRSDIRAARRNSYFRMFGMDLNHGTDDNRPYPYEKPVAANRDFVNTFEEFLREVWVGIIHFGATAAANPTDDAAIANLARRLCEMLTGRFQEGALSREEFFFEATMSWLHLTIGFNSDIVQALHAISTGAQDRLSRLAERIGMRPHPKSECYLQLAEPLSLILRELESGLYNIAANANMLYDPGAGLQADLRTIITQWSIATGRDLKLKRMEVVPTGLSLVAAS